MNEQKQKFNGIAFPRLIWLSKTVEYTFFVAKWLNNPYKKVREEKQALYLKIELS
jgi:hypothetical protein